MLFPAPSGYVYTKARASPLMLSTLTSHNLDVNKYRAVYLVYIITNKQMVSTARTQGLCAATRICLF